MTLERGSIVLIDLGPTPSELAAIEDGLRFFLGLLPPAEPKEP